MGGEHDQQRWRGIQPVHGIRGLWPAIDSERVNATAAQSGAGTTIVYTVPANKILFIASMFMVSRNAIVQQCGMHAFIRNVADAEVARLCSNYFETAGQQTSPMQYFPAQEAAAGFDVCVLGDKASSAVRLIFGGWLEDA